MNKVADGIISGGSFMSITVNIYYSGKRGNAKKFAEEMVASGIVEDIRAEEGNIRYDYFLPIDSEETVLLIDSWKDQISLDKHHASPMMELQSCAINTIYI